MPNRCVATLASLLVCLFLAFGMCAVADENGYRTRAGDSPAPDEVTVVPPAGRVSAPECASVPDVPHGYCYAATGGGGGLCQPQCIPYIRCRSGLSSCRLGNTSPVQLYLCEQRLGNTSVVPTPGSLMSIGIDRSHNITTGHTLYVEEVCSNPDGTYKLRISHANYDRRCHLEDNAWAVYDSRTMQADFITGHWAAWGNHLPVQGFILAEDEPRTERLPPLLETQGLISNPRPAHQAKAKGVRHASKASKKLPAKAAPKKLLKHKARTVHPKPSKDHAAPRAKAGNPTLLNHSPRT